nr:hypothetical protein [Morchella crassipes]
MQKIKHGSGIQPTNWQQTAPVWIPYLHGPPPPLQTWSACSGGGGGGILYQTSTSFPLPGMGREAGHKGGGGWGGVGGGGEGWEMHASLHLSLFALYECPFLYGLRAKGGGGEEGTFIKSRGEGGGRGTPICSVVFLACREKVYLSVNGWGGGQGADGWSTVKSAFMKDQYWSFMKAALHNLLTRARRGKYAPPPPSSSIEDDGGGGIVFGGGEGGGRLGGGGGEKGGKGKYPFHTHPNPNGY